MASSRSCSVTSSHRHAIVFMRLARERRRPSAPFVLAARLARLEDGHPNERRQGRLDALPHPRREELAGRVLEARQLIQVVVVEERVERRPRVVEELVVYEPAGARGGVPGAGGAQGVGGGRGARRAAPPGGRGVVIL